MTVEKVSIKPRRIELTADGVLTDFDFDFKIFTEDQVTVYLRDLSDVSTLQTITTDYTVTFDSEAETGTISFLSPPTLNFTVLMLSDADYEQQTDIPKGGGFSEPVIEKAYDLLEIQIQQLVDGLDRTVGLSETSPLTSVTLPDPAIADAPIGWNATADGLVNNPPGVNQVSVDTDATPDFLGAAANDGVLRTGNGITYADGGDFVTLTVDESTVNHNTLLNTHNLTTDIDHDTITNNHNLTTDIDHDLLTNFVADEHVAHTSVTLTAGDGLAGGGDISANRTFNVDIANATGATVASLDEILIADVDNADAIRKVTAQSIADLGSGGAVEVLDEGGSLTAALASIDFVGAGVTATTVGNDVTVTIPGGGGYSDPLTTRGDVLVRDASNVTNRLAIGGSGTVLTSDGTDVAWTAPAGGGGATLTEDVNQTTHGFSVGEVLYYDGANYALADASAASTAESIGIVSAVADANNFTIQFGGKITGLTGLTAGEAHFLSETAGALTATEPTTVGAVSKPILIADSTTTGFIFNMRGSEISGGLGSYTEAFVDADLTAGVLTVAHGLAQQYVQVQVFNNNDDLIIPDDVTLTDSNNLDIDLSGFGTLTGTWHVAVLSTGSATSSTASDLSLAGQAAEDVPYFDGTNWQATGGSERLKTGYFTRDTTIASGTQAITGVGFLPSAVLFIANKNANADEASWGVDDGTTAGNVGDNNAISAGAYSHNTSESISLWQLRGTDQYVGHIDSFDVDGFTVDWTRTGTPSGTAEITFIALR